MDKLASLNKFGKTNNGISRLAYTDEERSAKQFFIEECKALGMMVKVDSVGNVIARHSGFDNSLPAVAIGSHIDTVYSGGRFDGALGVVAGIEIVRSLKEKGIGTLHPIEVIAFTCEESSRFNFSTLGSKAMIGDLKLETLTKLRDRNNISIKDAFQKQNLNIYKTSAAERDQREIKVFYELHIEQGSKLLKGGNTIGIVTGIAAPLRLTINIEGKSTHSGSTEMTDRHDALLAAAELSLAVERAALAEGEYETVGTVGVLEVYPGAMNIVPGASKLMVDIRSTNVNSRNRVFKHIKDKMLQTEKERGVKISIEWRNEEEPVLMDKKVNQEIAGVCERLGYGYQYMSSGAGHDSMNMAKRWPTSLVFVPSVGGLSHHPDEFTKQADIAAGITLLEETVKEQAIVINTKLKGGSSWNIAEFESCQIQG